MDNSTSDFVGSGFKAVFQKPAANTTLPPLGQPAAAVPAPSPPVIPDVPPVTPPAPVPVVENIVEKVVVPQVPVEPVMTVPPSEKQIKKEKKNINTKSAILVISLVLLLGGLVAGFGKIRSFISQAEGTCTPESISESNLTFDSVEVVFATGKACQMSITYGVSSQALLLEVPETMASLNHRFRLTPLLPSTTYYYQAVSGEKKVSPVRSFLSKAPVNVVPTEEPVIVPPTENEIISTPVVQETAVIYTYEDFKSQFGGTDSNFDIDKNGVVNRADWLLYQGQ